MFTLILKEQVTSFATLYIFLQQIFFNDYSPSNCVSYLCSSPGSFIHELLLNDLTSASLQLIRMQTTNQKYRDASSL